MSLRIILGRGGCGKTTYMLGDMEENSDCVYIVPEQFSFSAEKKLIDAFGVVGLGNPQVLSFMRLADLVFSKYGAPKFISDDASFQMLVSYLANSIRAEKLKLFDGLVKKSDLADTAASLITTFKRYCITAPMLRSAIERTDDLLLKKKLSDALTVYEEYNECLKDAGVSDKNDTLSVLASVLLDEDCDYLSGKKIYIDQFSDFDPSEYECIKAMLCRAQTVCISLCTDGSFPFDTVNRTYNTLLRLAKECGTAIITPIEIEGAMHGAKPMIKHLEKCYFDDDSAQFAGSDGSLSVFCGKNRFSEIHHVARNIVRLVRDKGLRYRDISIIARDADLYKGIVERIFPFYDIPVFIDKKSPLSSHCVTLFITSILDLAAGGFTYENIFSYIKSPFSPLSREEADELENYCLAFGIRPFSWKKPFHAKSGVYDAENSALTKAVTEEKLEKINALRERVYTPLFGLFCAIEKKARVEDTCRHLFDFFEKISLREKIENYATSLEEDGENLYALQTKQVYNILVDIFTDICEVMGEKELTLNQFHTTVMAGLKTVEIGTIPVSSDCVTLGSIDRIKGHGARAVFLVGVNSGVFPASPSEGGLFTDEDKAELEKMGIHMPPSLATLAQSEQLLIYDAITCAGEYLYLSYAAQDSSSNALLPSEIVGRIRTLFPDIPYADDLISLPDDERMITAKKAVFDMLCGKIREYALGKKPLSPAMSAAAYYFCNDEVYAPLLNDALLMTRFENASSPIDEELISKVLGDNMKTSVTRLESYNKCPFSYFAKYLLKLEPKRTFEVSVSDSGSFLHDFLDRFSRFVSESTDEYGNPLTWHSIDNDFIRINTPVILEEVLCSVNGEMLEIPRIKALFDRLCRVAVQSVYVLRRHIVKSDFVPLGYEISFDEDGCFKPTKIKLDDGKTVTLRGRIDRADEFTLTMPDGESGRFVRIVDYKSSDKTLSLSDVYHGVQLQLFVYLSTLCKNGYSPAGILYYNLSDPIVEVTPQATEDEILQKRFEQRRMSGIVLSENDMAERMGGIETLKSKKTATAKNFNAMFRHLDKVIKNTAEDIYSGNFPIECTSDACDWCEYKHLCRFEKSFAGCNVRDNEKLKDDEVWAILEEGEI